MFGIFTLRNWIYFRLWLNNQQCYDKTDGTGGFSASNWSKTNPSRCSDCRLVMLYKVVKKLWAEFLHAELGTFLLLPQELQDLWTREGHSWIQHIKRVQKTTLEGIPIVVEGCFTAERNRSGLTKTPCTRWLLSFYTYPANCLVSYLLSSMALAVYCHSLRQVYRQEVCGNGSVCGCTNSDQA